jgi:hypothetical protein
MPDSVGRELAKAADALPIEGELVGVVDLRQVDGERARDAGDVNLTAIPGKAGVAGVGLGAPGLVAGDLLPTGVIEGGREPAPVVARVEAPVAVVVKTPLPGYGAVSSCARAGITRAPPSDRIR